MPGGNPASEMPALASLLALLASLMHCHAWSMCTLRQYTSNTVQHLSQHVTSWQWLIVPNTYILDKSFCLIDKLDLQSWGRSAEQQVSNTRAKLWQIEAG